MKKLYDPKSNRPFEISRSKIDLFLNCLRCFYLDRRLGISQPSGPPFVLNKAVDHLLKKEFDIYRFKSEAHPLMKHYGIEAVPMQHEKLNEWRYTFRGVRFLHQATNLLVFGAVDDIWIDRDDQLIVVDYKVTSTEQEISLDAEYKEGFKRQMEIYQWLLRQNGFKVSDRGYFVYCNGRKDKEAFNNRLEFDAQIIPYTGDASWVEGTLKGILDCLRLEKAPESSSNCDFCKYVKRAKGVEHGSLQYHFSGWD